MRHLIGRCAGAAVILAATLSAQSNAPFVTAFGLQNSSLVSVLGGTFAPMDITMIKNRAKIIGDQANTSGTRYFAVTDQTLAGVPKDQILDRLSTRITTADHIKHVEMVIELNHPTTIYGKGEVNVGTAIVQASGLRQLEVHSSIYAPGLRVIAH